MLYTRKGDDGTSKHLNTQERLNKDSAVFEALGTLDELNSYLGVCRQHCMHMPVRVSRRGKQVHDILREVQENLFIIQAELAGADKKLHRKKITSMERIIDTIEQQLPPISSFFVPGESLEGAHLDVARTLARRVERRVIAVETAGEITVPRNTRAYLNRLSSLLYALARLQTQQSGTLESAPMYR